jgi:hypothetical protein
MEDGKQFHINIFKDGQDKIDSSSNRAEAYIILANEELNNKNRDLLAELKELQSQNDIMTEDNERMEVTITNQRGMLHNLHGQNKMEENLSNHFEKINKDFTKEVDELKTYIQKVNDNVSKYFAYLIIVMLVQSVFGLIDLTTLIITSVNMVSIIYLTLKLHAPNVNHKSIMKTHSSFRDGQNTEIKRIQSEISETKRGTDHISDFIDSL